MDILIKNMDMPKEGSITITIRHDGAINFIGDMGSNLGRLVDCKAIELPPHGALKDVEEIARMIISKPCNLDTERLNHIYDCITKARTILEANNGNNN